MLFKDVIGQEEAKAGFFNFFNTGRLPHALLINAKEGIGGLPFALAIAQFILCENPLATDACGVCAACLKTQKLAHPDLHFSFPTISPKPGVKASSNYYMGDFRLAIMEQPYISTYDWLQTIQAENKQGNITAEECREIVDRLQLKAFEGGYKVQLIWRPEYLGKEGNILLKLIEEPPAQTILILVAEKTDQILNTILSRTQTIQLLPLSTQTIAVALHEKMNLPIDNAQQIALIADGSYAEALQLINYAGSSNLSYMKDWFNGIVTNKGVLIYDWVEQMSKLGREVQKSFFKYAQQILAYVMRYTFIQNYQAPLMNDELQFVQKLSQKQFSLSIFQKMDSLLAKTSYHIERNAHAKTQLLYISIQMQYLIKGNELEIF